MRAHVFQGLSQFSDFLHLFVLVNLVISKIKVKSMIMATIFEREIVTTSQPQLVAFSFESSIINGPLIYCNCYIAF